MSTGTIFLGPVFKQLAQAVGCHCSLTCPLWPFLWLEMILMMWGGLNGFEMMPASPCYSPVPPIAIVLICRLHQQSLYLDRTLCHCIYEPFFGMHGKRSTHSCFIYKKHGFCHCTKQKPVSWLCGSCSFRGGFFFKREGEIHIAMCSDVSTTLCLFKQCPRPPPVPGALITHGWLW